MGDGVGGQFAFFLYVPDSDFGIPNLKSPASLDSHMCTWLAEEFDELVNHGMRKAMNKRHSQWLHQDDGYTSCYGSYVVDGLPSVRSDGYYGKRACQTCQSSARLCMIMGPNGNKRYTLVILPTLGEGERGLMSKGTWVVQAPGVAGGAVGAGEKGKF
jgi:hypothetical protein